MPAYHIYREAETEKVIIDVTSDSATALSRRVIGAVVFVGRGGKYSLGNIVDTTVNPQALPLGWWVNVSLVPPALALALGLP